MSRVLVDTSVFIEAERRDLQALERLAGLLDEDAVAVSVVTMVELLASPSLPAENRRFYAQLLAGEVAILPVTAEAASSGIGAAREAGGALPLDILIAGTALEHGLKVVTFDAGLARLLGPSAELLRKS